MFKKDEIESFEEYSDEYLEKNPQEKIIYDIIIEENIELTSKENQEKYWNELQQILSSIKKTDIDYPMHKIPFGKNLNDLDFLELIKKAINYACYTKDKDLLDEMKDIFENNEDYTENIFLYPKVLKDIKKDSILSIIMGKTLDDKFGRTNLLKI